MSEANPRIAGEPPSRTELATFMRQLGALLDAGVEVLRALRVAMQQSGSPALQAASRDIARVLGDGREFHEALLTHPELFDVFCIEMARQGERDGLLGKALIAVSDYLDRSPASAAPMTATLPPAPAAPSGAPAVESVFLTLAAIALETSVFWLAHALLPGWIPASWVGPLAMLGAAVCLIYGARRVRRQPSPSAPELQVAVPALPQKSRERKMAEAEAVVRNAALEHDEASPIGDGDLNGG